MGHTPYERTKSNNLGMEDKKLTIEEIQCLSWFGMTSKQIKDCNWVLFDHLYQSNQEQFDEWLDKAERIFDREIASGVRIISIHDAEYPLSLGSIDNDAPPLIHLLGNHTLVFKEAVAVIGARAANRTGLGAAYALGKKFAEEGKVVVSGLAAGCDTSAHEGCLSVCGETIAVVASGLDITHPRENVPLQKRILANGGLLLSEQPFGTKANPTRLIARNRLQAALSAKVVLAQCPEHSGSMHTMRFARKYGKKCYAVAYPRYTETNGGNKVLLDYKLAKPIRP